MKTVLALLAGVVVGAAAAYLLVCAYLARAWSRSS